MSKSSKSARRAMTSWPLLVLVLLAVTRASATATPYTVRRLKLLFNADLPAVADTAHFRSVRDTFVAETYTSDDRALFAQVPPSKLPTIA